MSNTITSTQTTMKASEAKKQRGAVGAFFHELKVNKFMYFLALPGVVWFLVFAYLPMGGSLSPSKTSKR